MSAKSLDSALTTIETHFRILFQSSFGADHLVTEAFYEKAGEERAFLLRRILLLCLT
jgi:hypothetical protein